MRSFLLSSHVRTHTHTHTYRASPPSLLSCLAPVTIDTDGDERKRDAKRDRQGIAAVDSMSLHQDLFPLYSSHIFSPNKSHVSPPYIYPSGIHSYFSFTASIYHSWLPSIHQCSKRNHSNSLWAPTNSHSSIHSTNSSICSSNHILHCIIDLSVIHLFSLIVSIHPLLCV